MREKRHFETIDSRQLESLRVFHEVARALTSNLEIDSLLRTILSQMESFFGPEQWSLMIVEPETQTLYYALTAGIDKELLESVRIPMGEGIAGYVAATGTPLVIPNVSKDPAWSRYAAANPDLTLHSIASLPISHGGQMLGVLQLHNSKLDLMPDSSISFLRVLCDYAAIALHNASQVKLIHDLSITDDCTGLFNARHLYTSIEEEIATSTHPRVRPIQPHFSLIFLDLDHFKSINDQHGHLIGSRLLAEVGGVIKRTLGPHHSGFRYGGDEFVALLRGLDKQAATELANTLREQLNGNKFLTAQGMSLKLTASFGLATYPQDGNTLHAIIRAADTMMYVAKAEGRDRVSVADGNLPTQIPANKGSRHS